MQFVELSLRRRKAKAPQLLSMLMTETLIDELDFERYLTESLHFNANKIAPAEERFDYRRTSRLEVGLIIADNVDKRGVQLLTNPRYLSPVHKHRNSGEREELQALCLGNLKLLSLLGPGGIDDRQEIPGIDIPALPTLKD